jgi:translation initiation factor 3 subunit M
LSGKLSQTTQTLHITRSTARTFEREQWEALEKRLVAWKAGLEGVLDVVATARASAAGRRSGGANGGTVTAGGEKESNVLEGGKREVTVV